LTPSLAEQIKELFPPISEHADLVVAFQKWGKEDIELSPDQIKKALSAIRQHAIPQTQVLVCKQTHPDLRQDSEMMLNDWKALEAIFAGALR
jgi:hypothetical protein